MSFAASTVATLGRSDGRVARDGAVASGADDAPISPFALAVALELLDQSTYGF